MSIDERRFHLAALRGIMDRDCPGWREGDGRPFETITATIFIGDAGEMRLVLHQKPERASGDEG